MITTEQAKLDLQTLDGLIDALIATRFENHFKHRINDISKKIYLSLQKGEIDKNYLTYEEKTTLACAIIIACFR